MTAWLVSEDGLDLVRMDDIVSVGLVVPGEPDPREHPTKRVARAREVQLMVGGSGAGGVMCAVTCPGSDAVWARAELLNMVALLKSKAAGGSNEYVHAPTSWPRKRPARLWLVSSDIPEPGFARR